jgi:DNA-binding beta-propeller fold protein YncE
MSPPPRSLIALVANFGSSNVTPLTWNGSAWAAGSNVSVGTNPVGVAISPDGLHALVANYNSGNVTPLTWNGSVWAAGSNVSVGTGPVGFGTQFIGERR